MSAALHSVLTREARKSPRERVMLSAKLVFQGGSVSVPCVVSQISQHGARLSVSADVVLGQTMRLDIPQRNVASEVRLVWRRGAMAAVAFETSTSPVKAASKDSVEEENRRLRELVAQLEQRLKTMQENFERDGGPA